jgi:hypothetical protein
MKPVSFVLAPLPMPHKHNADRRHHIPKMKFKVENWPAYEAGLRRRGSLTLWITDEALDHWQTCGPGGPGALQRRGHPDELDAGFRVQNAAASDRRPDCVCHHADGVGDFNALITRRSAVV